MNSVKPGIRTVSANPPKILVIDDSRLIRVAAEKILSQDYDVIFAEDGEQGWKEIEQDETLQIIFSDLTMPRLDGFALLKRIRQSNDQRIKNIPMIIMTTEADDENRRETAMQLGATDFISKPFNSINLKARAKAHVTSEEITRELKRKADQLEHNAHRDALTGLNNRSYLMEKLWQDCSFSIRHESPVSLIRIDIESFNQYFVLYGKAFANEVIRKLASIIAPHLRSEDTAARIGLATFVIVRPGANTEDTMVVTAQIQKQVNATVFELGEKIIKMELIAVVLTPAIPDKFDVNRILADLDELIQDSLERNESDEIVVSDLWSIAQEKARQQACKIPGFDEALKMVAAGEGDKVKSCMSKMLEKLSPLLALASEKELYDFIDALKKERK